MTDNLVPFSPRRVPTFWTEPGRDDLATVLLRSVGQDGRLERVMLTGANPGPAWLLGALPEGWTHGAHHLDHDTFVGRYVHTGGKRLEIRRAAEWFGAGNYSTVTAATAWEDLSRVVRDAFGHGAGLLGSPGATGRELWLRSLPRDPDGRTQVPPQVTPEVAELLRATSGQHRIELMKGGTHDALTTGVAGATTPAPAMPGLWLLDGRLMYAACVRGLGTAPAALLTGRESAALLEDERGRYARARYRVRATVPTVPAWDRVGILPYLEDGADTWTYPATPGTTFETWADAAEVHLALEWGWGIVPLEGISFTTGRPLDTWAARLLRVHERTDPTQLGTERARMVRAGIRWMLLHAVGAWHSSGRTEATVTAGAMTRPAGDGWGAPERTAGGAIWRRRVPLSGRAALMAHPEYSAQIWGRARARILSAPTAERGVMAGALYTDPRELVSIYGDAVMTTERPGWAAPQYDDGKPGRLRVKGHLPGPLPWPTRGSDRDRLMHQAEAHTKENPS